MARAVVERVTTHVSAYTGQVAAASSSAPVVCSFGSSPIDTAIDASGGLNAGSADRRPLELSLFVQRTTTKLSSADPFDSNDRRARSADCETTGVSTSIARTVSRALGRPDRRRRQAEQVRGGPPSVRHAGSTCIGSKFAYDLSYASNSFTVFSTCNECSLSV